MDPHSIVVVSLHTPTEKVWGELLAINPSGITLRCIDLNSFDHFIRQINEPDGERMGFPTIFFPMNRVERIPFDERTFRAKNRAFPRRLSRAIRLNCVILNHDERPHLDGPQSNYVSASRLSAVLSDSHCLRPLPLGASGACHRRTFRWD